MQRFNNGTACRKDDGRRLTVPPSCEVCGTKMRPTQASSPRIINRGTVQTPKLCKKPRRSSSSLRVLRPQVLRNTSTAKRQAAKLCYRFGPLTPSARSANLIAGDGTKNGFSAPNKEPTPTKNDYLTEKAPYRFESISLQQRVYCEPAEFIVSGNKPSLRKAGCLASTALWTDSGARSAPPSSAIRSIWSYYRCA